MTPSTPSTASTAGIRRVLVVAWRDLDHPDAGGSEVHLHEILRRWAAAGLDVALLTGGVPGAPRRVERDGYTVERAGGPVGALLAMPWRARRHGSADATVEVWHGVNFGGPLWIRGPRVAIAHHVHRPEFGYVLPRPVAWLARHQEGTLSPRLYRGTPLVTLSEPARAAFADLGFDPGAITVVPPGVDRRFSPHAGVARSATPRILTVARLWPQKRIDRLVEVVARLRPRRPDVELVVVGDGPCRSALEARVAALGLGDAVRFTGTVDDAALVELYRSAWVLASASFGEGWGMTVTEAAACATPAVVVTNTGHRQAVVDGVTGVLADDEDGLVDGLDRVLGDPELRRRLGAAAAERARGLDWDRVATSVLDVLVLDAHRRARARRRGDRSPVGARIPGIPVDT